MGLHETVNKGFMNLTISKESNEDGFKIDSKASDIDTLLFGIGVLFNELTKTKIVTEKDLIKLVELSCYESEE